MTFYLFSDTLFIERSTAEQFEAVCRGCLLICLSRYSFLSSGASAVRSGRSRKGIFAFTGGVRPPLFKKIRTDFFREYNIRNIKNTKLKHTCFDKAKYGVLCFLQTVKPQKFYRNFGFSRLLFIVFLFFLRSAERNVKHHHKRKTQCYAYGGNVAVLAALRFGYELFYHDVYHCACRKR